MRRLLLASSLVAALVVLAGSGAAIAKGPPPGHGHGHHHGQATISTRVRSRSARPPALLDGRTRARRRSGHRLPSRRRRSHSHDDGRAPAPAGARPHRRSCATSVAAGRAGPGSSRRSSWAARRAPLCRAPCSASAPWNRLASSSRAVPRPRARRDTPSARSRAPRP